MGYHPGAFLKNESGTTAIEYGLIASGIALVPSPFTTEISATKFNTKSSADHGKPPVHAGAI